MERTRGLDRFLFTLVLAILAVVLIWPIWLTVRGAFLLDPLLSDGGFTLYHVLDVFRDPLLRLGLR